MKASTRTKASSSPARQPRYVGHIELRKREGSISRYTLNKPSHPLRYVVGDKLSPVLLHGCGSLEEVGVLAYGARQPWCVDIDDLRYPLWLRAAAVPPFPCFHVTPLPSFLASLRACSP